jgi:hypothetical protein
MFTLTTTIQEITLTANAHGVFDYLFNDHNMSRDEILNIFEDWGKEYEELAKKHEGDDNWFYYDEMDEFVDRKFTEIKLGDEFVEGDYIIYATGLYKITGFTSRGILVDEIRPRKDADDWVITEIGLSQVKEITLVSGYEIMDTTQNHDPELVYKINQAWNEKREQFCPILRALYERDIKEIMESDAWNWTDDAESVKEALHDEWDIHANNYLMHIADDWDLKAILYFLRYEA